MSDCVCDSGSTEVYMYFGVADGASSTGATNCISPRNFEQSEEVTQPLRNENKQNPKAACNPSREKKDISNEKKPEKREVTPTYKPRQFIGLVIYKEYNGVKSLGTVISYNAKKKLFKVEYKGAGWEFMEMNEILKSLATFKNLVCPPTPPPPPPGNSSKKTADDQKKKQPAGRKKKPDSGEGSTPTKKRRNTSSKKPDGPYVPLAFRETRRNVYCYYNK